MNWFNVPVEILRKPAFTEAPAEQLGTWLRLSCYCASQENGGLIAACSRWTDRQWLIAAGVTTADLKQDTRLWEWNSTGELVVRYYPHEKEREVAAKRKAGKATAKARWGKRFRKQLKDNSPDSSADSSATSSADAEREEEVERNGNGSFPRVEREYAPADLR